MRRLILLACLCLFLIGHAEAKPPKTKKAAKVLNLLKQVDGAGSGLDADTVQGMPPSELGGARLAVKDTNGVLVGTVVDQTDDALLSIVRTVGGQPVVFFVNAEGFTNDRSGFTDLYYTSTDCTGAPRIIEFGANGSRPLLPVALVQAGVAYYASGTVEVGETGSSESVDNIDFCDPASLTPRGGCCSQGNVADATSLAATVTLGSLGLVPPFHVEGP